jgi:hypothetical protein
MSDRDRTVLMYYRVITARFLLTPVYWNIIFQTNMVGHYNTKMKGEELIIEGLSYSGLNMWSTMPISIIKKRLIIFIFSSLFFFLS